MLGITQVRLQRDNKLKVENSVESNIRIHRVCIYRGGGELQDGYVHIYTSQGRNTERVKGND